MRKGPRAATREGWSWDGLQRLDEGPGSASIAPKLDAFGQAMEQPN